MCSYSSKCNSFLLGLFVNFNNVIVTNANFVFFLINYSYSDYYFLLILTVAEPENLGDGETNVWLLEWILYLRLTSVKKVFCHSIAKPPLSPIHH